MNTIAIAEDNTRMRIHISTIIKKMADYTLAFEASDGFQLLQYLNTARILPQFILVDIRMPYIDGLFVTDYICSRYPSICVLAISISNDPTIVLDFINAGAKGFLTKKSLNPTNLRKSLLCISENTFF